MRGWYKPTVQLVATGGLDMTSLTTIKVILIKQGQYTVDLDTHDFLDDIPVSARIATTTLDNHSFVNGELLGDTAEFNSVTLAEVVSAIVVYNDTGVESTSHLLAYNDEMGNAPLTVTEPDVFVLWEEVVARFG